mgnify:CR=1 FL=1
MLSGPADHVDRSTVEHWLADRRYGTTRPLVLTNDGVACTRLVVIAAHPDDESLGAGGLIATAAAAGLAVYVVLLTAGEASPYAAAGKSRHALATMRLAETENALARLAPDNFLVFLGAPDGAVADTEEQVARSLAASIGPRSKVCARIRSIWPISAARESLSANATRTSNAPRASWALGCGKVLGSGLRRGNNR